MADRNQKAWIAKALPDRFGNMNDRLSQIVVEDFEIMPVNLFSKPGSKRFDEGFFCGKPAGKMGNRILIAVAIILLPLCEQAV